MKFLNAALLALSLSFTLLPNTASAGLDEGLAALEKKDYTTALRELEPLAAQGNKKAQYELGYMYYRGHGVPIDYSEAAKLFTYAANQGYSVPQVRLGEMYYKGEGVVQDYKEALKWYRQTVAKGYSFDAEKATERISALEKEEADAKGKEVFQMFAWFFLIGLTSASILGLLPAFIAKNKGRNFLLWWLYGSVLFFIAFIHSLLMKADQKSIESQAIASGGKKCPYCAEIVKAEAIVCRYCQKDLSSPPQIPSTSS